MTAATLREILRRPFLPVLTVRQPWPDLIVAGIKPVENRSWQPPSTLPQWWRCPTAPDRRIYVEAWETCEQCVSDGPFPFRLGIHAAKQTDQHAPDHAWTARGAWMREWIETAEGRSLRSRTGVLLGLVTVTGCHHAEAPECVHHDAGGCNCGIAGMNGMHEAWCGTEWGCSEWAEPSGWHWTLDDPEPLDDPIPLRGRLGLWRLEP